MEHLPLPHNPTHGHPTIDLKTEQFEEPGSFLTYAERHGHLLTGSYPYVPTQADALEGRFNAGVSGPDIIDYHQGWLFFALLQEVLGDIYQLKNYLCWSAAADGSLESVSLSTKTL